MCGCSSRCKYWCKCPCHAGLSPKPTEAKEGSLDDLITAANFKEAYPDGKLPPGKYQPVYCKESDDCYNRAEKGFIYCKKHMRPEPATCMMDGCSTKTKLLCGDTPSAGYFSFCESCHNRIVADSYKIESISYDIETPKGLEITSTYYKQESHMNGKVYSGHVVRTKTVAAGEGVTAGVQVSEIVYTQKEAFISQSPDTARAVILAAAINKLGAGLNVNDPRQPIEVVLTVVG